MKPFSNNRLIDALYKSILLSALIHLVALAIYVGKTSQLDYFNMFHILGLDLYITATGMISFIFSWILYVVAYGIIYIFFTRTSRKH